MRPEAEEEARAALSGPDALRRGSRRLFRKIRQKMIRGAIPRVTTALYRIEAARPRAICTDAEHTLKEPWKEEAKGLRLVGHSDLNGWGDAFQIQVIKGGICYVAASGINGNDGITVLDVKDPRKPKVLNQFARQRGGAHPQGAADHRRHHDHQLRAPAGR